MACSVPKSILSNDQIDIIKTALCLQPKHKENKYNRKKVPDPIIFFDVVGDNIELPCMFASSLLQTIPNSNIQYPTTSSEFLGTLREHQISVEEEAWMQLQKYGSSTLGLYPGFGKTILGASLSSRAKLITCVLVNREILLNQWKNTFETFTNAKVWIVGEKNPPPVCDVIICMDTRWMNIPKAMRDAIGFLIIDEAHSFCTPTHVRCLLAFHPKFVLIESATLPRDDEMEVMCHAIAGKHGITRESDKPFSVMKIITNITPVRKKDRFGGVNWTALVENTLMNEQRNRLILDLVLANTTFKILILTSLKAHAMLLHESIDKIGIPCDYLCGTKRGYKDSTVLIGTTSKIGTGFDPATSCPSYSGRPFDLLLLVCSIQKYSALVQNIGRIFRSEFPTIMHFVDNDNIYKNHWYKARRWYLSHGGNITEHQINLKSITNTQNEWIMNKTLTLVIEGS